MYCFVIIKLSSEACSTTLDGRVMDEIHLLFRAHDDSGVRMVVNIVHQGVMISTIELLQLLLYIFLANECMSIHVLLKGWHIHCKY